MPSLHVGPARVDETLSVGMLRQRHLASLRSSHVTKATSTAPLTTRLLAATLRSQQLGLVVVLLLLGTALTLGAGSHPDPRTGLDVNNFLNRYTLIQMATDASAFAIMGVGATLVIIAGGIDLSVGAIYALAGVAMAMALRAIGPMDPFATVALGLGICSAVSLVCGALNGVMVIGLGVHPFIITLGTMWVLRGIAFVTSRAESILVPQALTNVVKAPLGLGTALYPVPLLSMLLVTLCGTVYLARTVWGRRIFAIGGNAEASRFSGLNVRRVTLGVFLVSGVLAGVAAFLGAAFYGSATSSDANGYELYVIASAVVGGASLSGGKGSAISAMLGALLIVMMRQGIRTLHLDQNYEWIIIGTALIVAVVLDQRGFARVSERFAVRR